MQVRWLPVSSQDPQGETLGMLPHMPLIPTDSYRVQLLVPPLPPSPAPSFWAPCPAAWCYALFRLATLRPHCVAMEKSSASQRPEAGQKRGLLIVLCAFTEGAAGPFEAHLEVGMLQSVHRGDF